MEGRSTYIVVYIVLIANATIQADTCTQVKVLNRIEVNRFAAGVRTTPLSAHILAGESHLTRVSGTLYIPSRKTQSQEGTMGIFQRFVIRNGRIYLQAVEIDTTCLVVSCSKAEALTVACLFVYLFTLFSRSQHGGEGH